MDRPIAFKVFSAGEVKLFRVRAEPLDVASINRPALAPAVVVTRKATILADLEAGIVDAADILALTEGDWSNAILVVTDDEPAKDVVSVDQRLPKKDEAFLQSVQEVGPSLSDLARVTVEAIRSAGVVGQLVEKTKGRWVNSPVNSFTLKVQPRKQNLQFTLYGNPSSYQHNDFLHQDQNSYSRGWVNNVADAKMLAELVSQSHARRTR